MVHFLKFALFSFDVHAVVRAARVLVFIIGFRWKSHGLGWRDGTRWLARRCFFLTSHGNRRWRRRGCYPHTGLDWEHAEAHAPHPRELRCDALPARLLILCLRLLRRFPGFFRSRQPRALNAPVCAYLIYRSS